MLFVRRYGRNPEPRIGQEGEQCTPNREFQFKYIKEKNVLPGGTFFWFRRKTTTRYAGEAEKVILMRRKKEPPVIE